MEKNKALKLIKDLPFDEKTTIFKEGDLVLFVLRPSQLSKRFKTYDVKKNFQIWLRDGEREFRPNYLRVMIDLFLRSRSRPDLKKELLLAFDKIFYGEDPDIALKNLESETFEHYLSPLKLIGHLAQLFIIEQEYAYHKESKYDPPTLFLQGWIRQFIDAHKEVDNLCMSVCNRQTPIAKYVKFENKKDKKYNPNLKSLWYLNQE